MFHTFIFLISVAGDLILVIVCLDISRTLEWEFTKKKDMLPKPKDERQSDSDGQPTNNNAKKG